MEELLKSNRNAKIKIIVFFTVSLLLLALLNGILFEFNAQIIINSVLFLLIIINSFQLVEKLYRHPVLEHNHQILLLSHLVSSSILLLITIQAFPFLFLYQQSFNLNIPFSIVHLGKMLYGMIVALTISYAILLLIPTQSQPLPKSYLSQGLMILVVINILYLFGDPDRFLLSDTPFDDLIDFGFIVFLVIFFWAIISMIFRYSIQEFKDSDTSKLLLTRGIILIMVIIPIDVLCNYLYLKTIYGFTLYEDYWTLEIPLKIVILLFINSNGKVLQPVSGNNEKSHAIKIKNGKQHLFIKLADVAYFIVYQKIGYLVTITGKKFILDQSLNRLEQAIIGQEEFFRASRQLLISKKAVQSYRSKEGKKIEIKLVHSIGLPSTHNISRLGAPLFRKWINDEIKDSSSLKKVQFV